MVMSVKKPRQVVGMKIRSLIQEASQHLHDAQVGAAAIAAAAAAAADPAAAAVAASCAATAAARCLCKHRPACRLMAVAGWSAGQQVQCRNTA